MKTKEQKRQEAIERNERWASMSLREQLDDRRGERAEKQRAKIWEKIRRSQAA